MLTSSTQNDQMMMSGKGVLPEGHFRVSKDFKLWSFLKTVITSKIINSFKLQLTALIKIERM